jgi:hypothetical protein
MQMSWIATACHAGMSIIYVSWKVIACKTEMGMRGLYSIPLPFQRETFVIKNAITKIGA